MIQPDENQIASRSYFIWEKEGRPEGKALEHWLRAKVELEAEAAGDNGGKPRRTRAATAGKPNGTTRARKPKAKPV
jgi:hypothetical protein